MTNLLASCVTAHEILTLYLKSYPNHEASALLRRAADILRQAIEGES